MPICTVTGSLRMLSARPRISSGMVAEKKSVWRFAGRYLRMRRMSGRKPMSHMRSASSSTSTSTWDRSMPPSSRWSSRRPGTGDDDLRRRAAAPRPGAPCSRRHRSRRCAPWCLLPRSHDRLVDLLGELARGRDDQSAHPAGCASWSGAAEWAGQRLPSCRCRSGPGPVRRGLRARRGWPAPGSGWAWCSRRPGCRRRSPGRTKTVQNSLIILLDSIEPSRTLSPMKICK